MDAERWQRVNAIFHQAIEVPTPSRRAFVTDAAGADRELRDEVLSLLEAHEDAERAAGGFIEASAFDAMPAVMTPIADDDDDADSRASLVGRQLGSYTISERIGQGGMGVVYLAEDTRLHRLVAIKALAPRLTRDARQRERLRREAQTAAGLSHPGIATVYALEELEGDLFIVSEFIRGRTLREDLSNGALPFVAVLDVARQIAAALAAAHERGVVHRDLKPENVMRSGDGHVTILDFGLAQLLGDSEGARSGAMRLTDTGTLIGTPGYMAPEQLRGGAADARVDQFAFGVLLYELATGGHPFAGPTSAAMIVRVLDADPAPMAVRHPGIPARFESIVRRCLMKDPAQRFASARELVSALEVVGAPAADVRVPASIAAPPLWWWRFHQLATSLVYCATLGPLWAVRPWMPPHWGPVVFVSTLVAALVATTLRLHLWFTSRVYPLEWAAQRERVAGWIRLADIMFAALILLAAVAILNDHEGIASIFVGLAVATILAFSIIEPATTRAAFRR